MSSPAPLLTPSPEPEPEPIAQPDHFYGHEDALSGSNGNTWLHPSDDPLAQRGIPVFKPTMDEFRDFEAYMNRIEAWGNKSGIVKIIPPEEWTQALPDIKPQLLPLKIKNPIEQHMMGRSGLFRQENVEKRRAMSIREWAELCQKDEHKPPGVGDVGLEGRTTGNPVYVKKVRRKAVKVEDNAPGPSPSVEPCIKEELEEHNALLPGSPATIEGEPRKGKTKRTATEARQARDRNIANRVSADTEFNKTFDPHTHWLPPNTTPSDYTPEFCAKLERHYWRNCGLSQPAWYGADCQGSLYTDEVKSWNVAHLPSTLSRLLPASQQGVPGVNTPYLYFGMWRATFAWHVEDMDLFSINYIHFGAPKFWYSVPQGRAGALEQTMRGYFPADTSNCPQFLRHKSFLASPKLLAQSSCRPNLLVQHAGEFVVTFPRGYHAGFNLGFNCAESVNFALDSWIELGKKAQACACIPDSVRIDVNQLLQDREEERLRQESGGPLNLIEEARSTEPGMEVADNALLPSSSPAKLRMPKKRKSEGTDEGQSKPKKARVKPTNAAAGPSTIASTAFPAKHNIKSIRLKLGPRPAEPEAFPCCLCISMDRSDLLRVHDPPVGRKDVYDSLGKSVRWMAHESCAKIIPETWVDDIDVPSSQEGDKEKVVFGVDGIVKDRWNLKCSVCTKTRQKTHGAPIQCSKGKCPKAFHVSCAKNGDEHGIVFNVVQEVEKEVVLMDPSGAKDPPQSDMNVDPLPELPGDADIQVDESVIAPAYAPLPSQMESAPMEGLVLKTITKTEVFILCPQHNPAKLEEKMANKQDKIRNDLLALPIMSRIKIRVSSGVFEVSLLRVIPETGSVEVLWDREIKREFKWGSVVFGATESTVMQRPSELVPEPPVSTQYLLSSLPQNHYSAPYASSSAAPSSTSNYRQHNYLANNVQSSDDGNHHNWKHVSQYAQLGGSSIGMSSMYDYSGGYNYRAALPTVSLSSQSSTPAYRPHKQPTSWNNNSHSNSTSRTLTPQGYLPLRPTGFQPLDTSARQLSPRLPFIARPVSEEKYQFFSNHVPPLSSHVHSVPPVQPAIATVNTIPQVLGTDLAPSTSPSTQASGCSLARAP